MKDQFKKMLCEDGEGGGGELTAVMWAFQVELIRSTSKLT